MRRIKLSLMLLLIALNISAQEVSVQVKRAGTLADCLDGYDIFAIKSLVVTGSINGADIYTLRQMAGYDPNDGSS